MDISVRVSNSDGLDFVIRHLYYESKIFLFLDWSRDSDRVASFSTLSGFLALCGVLLNTVLSNFWIYYYLYNQDHGVVFLFFSYSFESNI